MNEKKLRIAWIGTLVGAFVLIVAMVLVWKFKFYDPLVSELGTTSDNYTKEKAQADKLPVALTGALLAQQRLGLASGELQYFRARYRSLPMDLTESPIVGQGPRNATFYRYLDEYASGFGLAAREQLIRAADESGVQINTDIKVQAPPQNPEDIVAPPSGLLKPQTETLGVTITGTFGSILEFFQIINKSEILMTIGNVKMEGTSPAIKATFTITPYLLVSGNSATQAVIPGIDAARPGAAPAAPPAGAEGADAAVGPDGEVVNPDEAAPPAPAEN